MPAEGRDVAAVEVGIKALTVSNVIECLGLTGHHRYLVIVVWCVWFASGWATTQTTFLLDAAAEEHSSWVDLSSPAERLTIKDRSFILLGVGIVSGAFCLLFGNLSDFLGRIPILQCSIVLVGCATTCIAFTETKLVLILLVFVAQMDASPLVTQSLLAEWLPVNWRGYLLVSLTALWNMGRLGVTLVWAFLPPAEQWKAFFLLVGSLPVTLAIFLVARGHRYESPRWLVVNGNMAGGQEVLRLAADTVSTDAQPLPQGWDESANLQLECDSGETLQADQLSTFKQLSELCQPKLKHLILVLGFCYFAVSFAWSALFYWTIEYLKMLDARAAIVPVMVAAPIGKCTCVLMLLAPVAQGQSFVDVAPRALLLKVGFLGTGVGCALLCATTNVYALTAIMFGTQIFEGFIWTVGGLYTAEVFPTTVRNTATGVTWCIGTVGSIFSAAVTGELMGIWVYLPMVSCATLLMIGCASCFLLTEERGLSPLVDTMGYGTNDGKSA